jgi:hypothetical protein
VFFCIILGWIGSLSPKCGCGGSSHPLHSLLPILRYNRRTKMTILLRMVRGIPSRQQLGCRRPIRSNNSPVLVCFTGRLIRDGPSCRRWSISTLMSDSWLVRYHAGRRQQIWLNKITRRTGCSSFRLSLFES